MTEARDHPSLPAKVRSWYPLRLTTTIRPLVHGGRALTESLGRTDLPSWSIAESWEVCDAEGDTSYVTNGRFAGCSLRELAQQHPQELVGDTDGNSDRFPVFAKFLDASGVSPPQLDHGTGLDGAAGVTVWHVLDAPPGASAHCGVRDGVSDERLRQTLMNQDFDAVLRRVPIRPGNTIQIPDGTIYSFGPNTLLFAVAVTTGFSFSAARWSVEDGSARGFRQWDRNMAEVVRLCRRDSRPMPHTGQPMPRADDVNVELLEDRKGVVVERWQVAESAKATLAARSALTLTNVAEPACLRVGAHEEIVPSARTVVLPAALRSADLWGPADVLVSRAGPAAWPEGSGGYVGRSG